MKGLYKVIVLALLLIFSTNGQAGVYWVGSSAECTGSNVYQNLVQALAVAAFNGDSIDEIRLTNTVVYTGNTNGSHTLTDWNAVGFGVLTIAGGYANCFTSPTGKTVVGYSGTSSFTVNTSSQTNSVITLKNLILRNNDSRGLVVRSGGIVTLDNVEVRSNAYSGVDVGDGGSVEILANSLVTENDNINNPSGGGIRCTGTNSSLVVHGIIEKNRAQKGGNLFVSTGCNATLKDGMRIIGGANGSSEDANEGGGAYVDNGGYLFADGRANRVIFDNNIALTSGGALYVNGTGFVKLQNTHFNASSAVSGAAIYAKDGGLDDPQLIMDQTVSCSLLFRCSEIQGSKYQGSVVHADNSLVQISRTVVELSEHEGDDGFIVGLIHVGEGKVRLNRVGILRNEGYWMLGGQEGSIEATHVTIAANLTIDGANPKSVALANTSIEIENSLISQSSGSQIAGVNNSFVGDCNLVDNNSNWPVGTYYSGSAQMINPAAGDARQIANSPGVDMCLQDSFAWSTEIDIENQAAPVNESTNSQGMPGDVGGLYDAGFDEVYDNIGDDIYLLSITKEGTGTGHVFSSDYAIDCGAYCSKTYVEGTMLTIAANPDSSSVFTAWHNCPSESANLCFIQINGNRTVSAEFNLKPPNLIFSDSLE